MCHSIGSLKHMPELARRVLLVEDNADTLRALTRLLTLDGYQVLPAPNVERALEQLVLQPDFVITDLMLPDGSGLDVLRRLREREDFIPVAIYTGASDERVREAVAAGPDAIFRKPLGLDELRAWLKDPRQSHTQIV
jgi:DNA-binding response OmpR family regulator